MIHTINLSPANEGDLRHLLEKEGYMFSPLQYGFWLAKKGDISIAFYTSGKVVLNYTLPYQKEAILTLVTPFLTKATSQLGCDESGKGDVFGPLVLAAVAVSPEAFTKLNLAGLSESKKASLNQVENFVSIITRHCQVEYLIWEPETYNTLYEQYRNVNNMLTFGYKTLLQKFDQTYEKVIVDAYASEPAIAQTLASVSPGPLVWETKAEKYISVCAASLIARKLCLDWFEKQDIRLPRGASHEAMQAYKELVTNPSINLRCYVKLNFRIS